MTQSISHLVHINGINGSASPEAQRALQRIAENLHARGIDLQAGEEDQEDELKMIQELDILNQLSALEIKSQVQPSRIPIIGGLITRIKQAIHQLVLFYVRDLAAQQNAFNAQTLHVIKKMITQNKLTH